MKIKLLLLSVAFSTFAVAQTDTVPAKFELNNATLHFTWSDVAEKDVYSLQLRFRYDIQTKTRIRVADLTKAIPLIAKSLQAAVGQWKEVNKESKDLRYWEYYLVDIGLYSPKESHGGALLRYIIDHRNDSLVGLEKTFSMADSVTSMEYIYDIAYLDKLTGLTSARRVKLYKQLAAKIYQCAADRVAPMLAAWDEKVKKDDIAMHNRYGRRNYYLDCFRGLIKKHIKTSNPDVLKALYAELTTQLGDEDEWENYGVQYDRNY